MTLKEAKKKERVLKQTANKLLKEKNIEAELKKYGRIQYVGSYASGLMVKPDIDLELIVSEYSIEQVMGMTKFFVELPAYSVEVADGTEWVRRAGHPKGYYIGPDIIFDEERWGLDIWVVDKENAPVKSIHKSLTTHDWYKNLSQVELDTILLIKHQLAEEGEYKNYASANVYQAVLDGVANLDEFITWAEKNKAYRNWESW